MARKIVKFTETVLSKILHASFDVIKHSPSILKKIYEGDIEGIIDGIIKHLEGNNDKKSDKMINEINENRKEIELELKSLKGVNLE